jgi:atypical dual specificity phosphatase
MMTKIWDRIYLGSLKDARQLATTNPCGIVTVLSLCEEAVPRLESITYVHLPIADSRPIAALRFEEIMKAIADRVRRGNLLVHCVGGMSRSPIILAAWLHRCGYAPIERALVEIAEMRDIDPSPVLLKSVQERISR